MSSIFEKSIQQHAQHFSSVDDYLTLTRKSGSEILTFSKGKITVTNLNSSTINPEEKSCHKLDVEVTFEPLGMVMNQSETLLCVYNASECWILSLGNEGSKISFTVTYKLAVDLVSNSIIQVVFNNVSKYQSEIVMLTNNDIRAYSVESSLSIPVQLYNFKQEYETNVSVSSGKTFDESIVDPVSIAFASHSDNVMHDPQNDMTLLLLTSDSSIYKIYPFFPQKLSVEKEWISNLFDFASFHLKSADDELEKAKLFSTVKVAVTLLDEKDSHSIDVKKALGTYYNSGKISGPLVIDTFPDELYGFDALKLIPFPNNIISIVFNHAVAVYSMDLDAKMIFQKQKVELEDHLMLLDTVIFNLDSGKILTADIHPVTKDSLILVSSNSAVTQVDFSQWMDELSNGLKTGDLSTFSELCQKDKLPTEIIALGKMNLRNYKQQERQYPLREFEHKIWYAWNSREVFSMFIKQNTEDVLSLALISADNQEIAASEAENQEVEDHAKSTARKYSSLLVGDFKTDVLPEIKVSLGKISEINTHMAKTPSRILNEVNISAKDLEAVHQLSELATTGQLILFKVLAMLTSRLKMMRLEYHNQLDAYHQATLKLETIISKYFRMKTIFAEISDRQEKLKLRLVKSMTDTEVLEANKQLEGLSISKQESSYFKELERMRDFILKKEKEIEDLNKLLTDVQNAEMETLLNNKHEVLQNFDNKRSLENMKQNLEEQQVFIQYLTQRLSEVELGS